LGSEITSIVEAFMHRGIRRGSTADMFLRRWLPMFNVGDSVNVTPVEGMAFKITINVTGRKGSPINLADLGFGAGQILTILLQIASVIERQEERAKAGKSRNVAAILLIEEPEANLHPQLQSLLAVLFEEVTRNFSIRLIVETHSEYLIRKLQLLVASAKVGVEHGNNVMLYYMDQTLDDTGLPATSVRRIIIQPDGKLSDDFGNGFFDEADENAMELYRLQKKAARQLLA
jgi:predicted ATPase